MIAEFSFLAMVTQRELEGVFSSLLNRDRDCFSMDTNK